MKIRVPTFTQSRVLVVGDIMLDRYWYGSTSRISPEAPVPVVLIGNSEERVGGAGNVALNISTLGGKARILALSGDDKEAKSVENLLNNSNVDCVLHKITDKPTITKLRVLSRHQQLIRLDFEDGFSVSDAEPIIEKFNQNMDCADVIILSDYGKGTLNNIQDLIASARKSNKIVLIDPKGNDFSIYRNASLITPNLNEFRAVVGDCSGDQEISEKGMKLIHEINLTALLVTRGEQGMTLLQKDDAPIHMPTLAQEVYDVTGAGDTVISVLAAALSAGQTYPCAAALANLAAGIVVGKVGTATVSLPELRRACQALKAAGGLMTEESLKIVIEDAKNQGEKIVMTNGCFDILHVGHISYLEEARKLGDRLVVAVNNDDSVRQLKGEGRPINYIEHRMAMLEALEFVDWVVPFSEQTPERLICKLEPDILVKGGDYKAEDVAGYDCVTKNGGEVKILNFIDGHSTTNMINKIQKQGETS